MAEQSTPAEASGQEYPQEIRGSKPQPPPRDAPPSQARPRRVRPASRTYTFDPYADSEGQLAGRVTRRVKVNAPPQMVKGRRETIVVEPQKLGPEPRQLPAKRANRIRPPRLVKTVIHLHVFGEQSLEPVVEFDPPLRITVEYTSEDLQDLPRSRSGRPVLTLFNYYQASDSSWRWKRLRTKMHSSKPHDTGHLAADIKHLAPKDPTALGHP